MILLESFSARKEKLALKRFIAAANSFRFSAIYAGQKH